MAVTASADPLQDAFIQGFAYTLQQEAPTSGPNHPRSRSFLSMLPEPPASHAGHERDDAASYQIDDGKVARDQKCNNHGDRCGYAWLDNRSSCGLEAHDKPPDRERENVEYCDDSYLAAAQLNVFHVGGTFDLRPKDQRQKEPGDQVEDDHHQHANSDPL